LPLVSAISSITMTCTWTVYGRCYRIVVTLATGSRRDRFTLADGTPERNVSECHILLPQGDGHTPVVLGEPGDAALLGAVTLEELGLVFNPFTRTLHHARLLMI